MPVEGTREPLLSWRRLSYALTALLLLLVAIIGAGPNLSNNPLVCAPANSSEPAKDEVKIRYTDVFGNIGANTGYIDGLTTAECRALFPQLYTEIDRAVAYWKGIDHTIEPEDVSIDPDRKGVMRLLIYENGLRVLNTSDAFFLPFRSLGQLSLLQRAFDSASAAGEVLPTIEVLLNFKDDAHPAEGRTHTYWSTARNVSSDSHQRIWIMPNFDFWYSPPASSYHDSSFLEMQYDGPKFAEKIPKLLWRGNALMNQDLRGALIDITEGKEWADVVNINGFNDPKDKIEVFQYCRYAMTVYTEGISFSGRLKFLMNCPSLLFMPDSVWSVHYDHLLVSSGDDQNYVAVSHDWSDLEEKVLYYLAHPDEADRIIGNMLSVFRSRYTTRAATSCYIRELVKGYAEVSFKPEPLYPIYDGEVMAIKGRPYERYHIYPGDGDFEFDPHIYTSY